MQTRQPQSVVPGANLRIRILEGRACPVILCDACGREIRNGMPGHYMYDMDCFSTENDSRISFACNQECSDRVEGQHPEVKVWGWMNLKNLLAYLATSLNVNVGDVQRSIAEWGL